MKKATAIFIVLVFAVMVSGCGDPKVIHGVEYETYGLFNKEDSRSPDIKYKVIIGNVVWSIILVETIAAPIYFLGFSLYEPVRPKTQKEIEATKNRG
jgi:hypothetical protein